jgi:hypothetical protein
MAEQAHCSTDNFFADGEKMDLGELFDLQFMVAVSTGHRDDGLFLCKTVHGVYNFDEMISEVSAMWSERTENAKVIILNKDSKTKVKYLDAKTIEYIQLKVADICMDRILGGDTSYTCKAAVIEDQADCEPPTKSKKKTKATK